MNWGKIVYQFCQKNYLKILGGIIAFGILILLGINKKNDIGNDTIVVENYTESTTVQESTEVKNLHENLARSKLTGMWVDDATVNNSPVTVMFSNIIDAMPQSSISYADIVFESLVEGKITRLCGIFENCTTLTKIGPVRSCRTYYLQFAKEFESTYVHFGYSEYAAQLLQNPNMHSLDGMVYCNFYRSTDRVAPHNAYTSWDGIMKSVAERNYPTQYPSNYKQPFTFNANDSSDITIKDGQKCSKFSPGYVNNKPYFTYNESDKLYYRFQFDQPQIDAENGMQLKYKNILVKYVDGPYWPNGTPNYTVTGKGKGLYITDGKAVEVNWKNETANGPTKYYNSDGTEVILNQGKTWICQIESSSESSVQILDIIN